MKATTAWLFTGSYGTSLSSAGHSPADAATSIVEGAHRDLDHREVGVTLSNFAPLEAGRRHAELPPAAEPAMTLPLG